MNIIHNMYVSVHKEFKKSKITLWGQVSTTKKGGVRGLEGIGEGNFQSVNRILLIEDCVGYKDVFILR